MALIVAEGFVSLYSQAEVPSDKRANSERPTISPTRNR
jgi:hypothetical protein